MDNQGGAVGPVVRVAKPLQRPNTQRQTAAIGSGSCAYNLKNVKRATIVGEVTGGGAHPTAGRRLDDHFMIGVPFARAFNPLTKTSWKAPGVEPDV